MELWIRSQNREILGKFDDIVIKPHKNKDWLDTFDIIGYFDKNTEYEILGNYYSQRRALEILNYIQNELADANNTDRVILVMPVD